MRIYLNENDIGIANFSHHNYDQDVLICQYGEIPKDENGVGRTWHDRWEYSVLEKARKIMGHGELSWDSLATPENIHEE